MSGGGNDHNGRGGQSPTSSQHGNLPLAETVLPFMFYVQAGSHKRSRSKPFQIDVMGAKTFDDRLAFRRFSFSVQFRKFGMEFSNAFSVG